MKLSEFDFDLPPECIAQHPTERRDGSRLMTLDRDSGAVEHRRFPDLAGLLDPGDLLVFNDTRVVPARLHGRKQSGGRVEILVLPPVAGVPGDPRTRRCLIRSARTPPPGSRIDLDAGMSCRVVVAAESGYDVRFETGGETVDALLARAGEVPLPPYIKRDEPNPDETADRERYQTVVARHPGAVAAPTAGLHFTRGMLERLAAAGIGHACLTLHVGPGTFLPVRGDTVEEHTMHAEPFTLPGAVAEAIDAARRRGGRVIAVGTTVVRTLESAALQAGRVAAGAGECALFIHPGYRFRVVDALITNFHLPCSTLLLLVCAFAGREHVLEAYRQALAAGYRFYSYGDAMLIRSPR